MGFFAVEYEGGFVLAFLGGGCPDNVDDDEVYNEDDGAVIDNVVGPAFLGGGCADDVDEEVEEDDGDVGDEGFILDFLDGSM